MRRVVNFRLFSSTGFGSRLFGETSAVASSATRTITYATGAITDSVVDAAILPAISAVKRTRHNLSQHPETENTDVTISISIPGIMSITMVNKKS